MLKIHHLINFISFALIFIVSFADDLKAQTNQDFINQQDWITRQQQNRLEEERRAREEEAIEKERERRKKQEEEKRNSQSNISGKSEKCFPIKSVKLTDAKSISKLKQKQLIKPFIGRCVSIKILNEIITELQTYYNKKGYVTARIVVPKQNIRSGNLKLKALEGFVGKLSLNDDSFTDKMQKVTAFGFLEGEILNIEDINQGIYQMNRLPSNNAIMKIEPGKEEGEATVKISNKNKFPARASIAYDNLGNEFTGIRRTTFNGSLDNLLFLNDAINLSYVTNLNDNSQNKDLKSFSSTISIPFAYNTFSYNFARTEFRGTNQGQNSISKLTGYSQNQSLSLDRVLFNQGNLRISGISSITTKDSASYLNNSKIETSQRKLTVGNIDLVISNYFKNGVSLYLKPSYYKGLKILNAQKDQKNIPSSTPKAQFDYFKLYTSLSKRILIPTTNIPVRLSTEIDSQYSKQTLFGTEQFSVGGYHSVRGFREGYINGDSGYYTRNKLGLNLGSFISPLIKNNDSKGFLAKNLHHLNKFSIEPFYDYGHVRNKFDGSNGRLSGAGIKTLFNSKYFTASLTYSWAIGKSALMVSDKKENKMLYFEFRTNCC